MQRTRRYVVVAEVQHLAVDIQRVALIPEVLLKPDDHVIHRVTERADMLVLGRDHSLPLTAPLCFQASMSAKPCGVPKLVHGAALWGSRTSAHAADQR